MSSGSTDSLTNTPPSFLQKCLPAPSDRPHITVTWAQSLDFKIAGPGGQRVILSGNESMLMTHWMRSMHDAILVGINTIVMDDPRLQINLLPQDQGLKPPQPLILDPRLRFPLDSRILQVWSQYQHLHPSDREEKIVRQPWIICGDDVAQERIEEVEDAGAKVIAVSLDTEGRIAPTALPGILKTLRLRSVMIEGGSRILSSFLRSPPRSNGTPVVDSVIVTVAPMFIGKGVGVVPKEDEAGLPTMETVHTEAMGKDAVMVCKLLSATKQ